MVNDLSNVKLHLVDSVDDAMELMQWLSTTTRIAVDTETSGLDPERDHVRLVQVGDAVHGWTIPWQRWGGVFVDIVRRYQGEWVAHNMKFDVAMLAVDCDVQLPVARIDDTRIMAHVLHPDHSTALKSLAAQYVDKTAAHLSKQLDEALGLRTGWTWATVPVDYGPYWQYAALDTVLTARLDERLRPEVLRDAPHAYDLERGVTWVAYDMERLGPRIDREYARTQLARFDAFVDQADAWCRANYGVPPGSNVAVVERLKADGIEFSKRTRSGNEYALDKEVLSGINHPLAEMVLARRQVQKVASTYLHNFLTLADDDDVLHPRINTLGLKPNQAESYRGGMGVRTGRMSMDNPNLQNLNRPSEGPSPGNVVRDCIISREGHTLLMIDFDQIEARMFAHMANDPGLIAAFNEGDFFTNVAREIFDDPTITKKDPRRQPTKNGVYARYYGAGTERFAVTAGIPIEAAAAFNQRFDQLYPGARAFMNLVQRVGRERYEAEGVAYVRSPLTNRRHTAEPGREYVLTNYLIQGTAAEVLKMKMLEMSATGLGDFMILPVHDEIMLDVPDDQLAEVIHIARGVMNDDRLFRVPLTASPSVGKRWGQKVEVAM